MKHISSVWERQQWKSPCERWFKHSVSIASWTAGKRFLGFFFSSMFEEMNGLGHFGYIEVLLVGCPEEDKGRNGLCLSGGEHHNTEDLITKYLKLFFLYWSMLGFGFPAQGLSSQKSLSFLTCRGVFCWLQVYLPGVFSERCHLQVSLWTCPSSHVVAMLDYFLGWNLSRESLGKTDPSSSLVVCKAV